MTKTEEKDCCQPNIFTYQTNVDVKNNFYGKQIWKLQTDFLLKAFVSQIKLQQQFFIQSMIPI